MALFPPFFYHLPFLFFFHFDFYNKYYKYYYYYCCCSFYTPVCCLHTRGDCLVTPSGSLCSPLTYLYTQVMLFLLTFQ